MLQSILFRTTSVVSSPRDDEVETQEQQQQEAEDEAFVFEGKTDEEEVHEEDAVKRSSSKASSAGRVGQQVGNMYEAGLNGTQVESTSDANNKDVTMAGPGGSGGAKGEEGKARTLKGAKKRKPVVIRRYLRVEGDLDAEKHGEVEANCRRKSGFPLGRRYGEAKKGSDDVVTLTAEDVFKTSELELLGGRGFGGWRFGQMPRNREVIKDGRNGRIISLSGNVVGSDDGKRSREQVKTRGKFFEAEQSEAFDLSCKRARPESSTGTYSEESFVTPEVLLEEGTGGVSLWEDSRPREALGDFVYAAAVASHGEWRKTGDDDEDDDDKQNDRDERRWDEEHLAHSVSFEGQREDETQNNGSIASEAEVYQHNKQRSVVTSSEDVMGLQGLNPEFQEETAEPSSTSWVFTEPQRLPYISNTSGQTQPQFQMSTRHDVPQQIPQKRPRGRPRQTPIFQPGGPASEVSTTARPSPKRGRPKGTGGGKQLSATFCGSKTCLEREQETKRLRQEKRAATKALRALEKSKREQETMGEDEDFVVKAKKPKQIRYRTERPFTCPHCPGSFTLRSNMERHGKQQHPSLWMPSPSVRHQRRKNDPQKTDYGVYWDENTTQY